MQLYMDPLGIAVCDHADARQTACKQLQSTGDRAGAILAVGASVPTVVATKDGMIGVKKLMKVNITCDHRIIYGAHAAEFLQDLKKVIEEPDVLLR